MALVLLAVAVLALAFVCLFVGSSHMSFDDCVNALLKKGSAAQVRIVWNIRIPRVLAAIIAGAGLSVSGLIMQTNLNNPMASPSTLGVSNAAEQIFLSLPLQAVFWTPGITCPVILWAQIRMPLR